MESFEDIQQQEGKHLLGEIGTLGGAVIQIEEFET